jgi:GDP-L-fucose synthase
MTLKNIFLTGHRGMVGSAVYKHLLNESSSNVIVANRYEVDLLDSASVDSFFSNNPIDIIIHTAAKVGGISAVINNPYEFLYENLQIQNNVLSIAANHNISKLLFIGSSCIFPRDCPQPMREEYLLSGPLEKTLEPFALAKICGIKMCQAINQKYGFDYRSLMPSNLYGPNDNFSLETSHVIPAFIRKFNSAKINNKKSIELWGTGNPIREFLHVNDFAEAITFVNQIPKEKYNQVIQNEYPFLNTGTGHEIKISDLAKKIAKIVGYEGDINFNSDFPDGAPRKVLNINKIEKLGWKSKIGLTDGLNSTFKWFKDNADTFRDLN